MWYRALTFLIWILLNNVALAGYKIEVVPAWEGELFPGSITELRGSLLSAEPALVQVSISNNKSQQTTNIALEANTLKQVWLPILPSDEGVTSIKAYSNGTEIYSKDIPTAPDSGSEFVIANLLDADHQTISKTKVNVLKNIITLYPGHASLPRNYQAYDGIDGLIFDEALLRQIDDRQLDALLGYIGNCGRIFVLHAQPELMTILTKNAGCQAQNIQQIESLDDAYKSISLLSGKDSPYAISIADTLAINPRTSQSHIRTIIVAYLSLYLASLLILPKLSKRPVMPFLLVVGGFSFILLFWSYQKADINISSWSEVFTGDKIARFSAIVQIDGKTIDTSYINVPDKYGLPFKIDSGDTTKTMHFDYTPISRKLKFKTNLLSRDQYFLHGIYKSRTPLSINLVQGKIIIQNISKATSLSAVLNWNNSHYRVPALQPNATWSPTEKDDFWPQTAIESLFRKKTVNDMAAILIRNDFNCCLADGEPASRHGWLVIRKKFPGTSA